MVQLTKIYTRGGDKGQTSLGDGTRVPKQSLRVEAAELSDCSGIAGRDPEPPTGHYCR